MILFVAVPVIVLAEQAWARRSMSAARSWRPGLPAPSCCSGGGVRVWPLLSTAVVVALTTALTYGQQRFRVAAEPSLVVLAAVSVAAVGGRRRVESSTESRKSTEGT